MFMKEIGGYIELDTAYGEEYHKNAIALNSGRHCLEYLIRAKKIEKIYIPYFLCDSVKELCEKCGCLYEFYHININFKPVFDKALKENEYLYIVNYYGQLTDDDIQMLKTQYENIIIDNAQDFFRLPMHGIDTLYTCRKFFGVSDGGYLYTDRVLNDELPIDRSYDRIHYILGRFECGAEDFFKESQENNKLFAVEELKQMSKLTHNLLRGINYQAAAEKRSENFSCLHKGLSKINKLKLNIPYGAFMYPLYVDNGAELKKKLIQKKIFVPTLWADVFDVTEENSLEWNFARNIIPLPVDQRYDANDMKYIRRIIDEK